VASGWVKRSRTTVSGHNFIVELLFPGDYFDLTTFGDGFPSSLTASGLNRFSTELNCLNSQRLRDPNPILMIQRQINSRMRQQQETTVALATYSVEKKVLLGLQRRTRHGGRREGDLIRFPLLLTRQELGEWKSDTEDVR
jgi:CRP-like cAMP-binding protein